MKILQNVFIILFTIIFFSWTSPDLSRKHSFKSFAFNSSNTQFIDLFFSEYIEGSSSNKALEIFNPTKNIIDLNNYTVYRNNNGSLTPTDSLHIQGTLGINEVFIITNPSANPTILAQSDTTHTITFYNGDDAVWLKNKKTGDTIDIIGDIGVDPGSGWPVGTGATNNFTLIRMISNKFGQKNWAVGATEWDVFPIDMADSLGDHHMFGMSLVNAFIKNQPLDISILEDTQSSLDLSATVLTSTVNSQTSNGITLNIDCGVFSTPADGSGVGVGVTTSLISDTEIRLIGTLEDIDLYLDTPSNIQYTPPTDLVGNNEVRFMISSEGVSFNEHTLTYIDIENGTPEITQGETVSVTMSEDANPTPFSLTLNATDPQTDVLTWSILTPATNGTATASGTGNSKSIGYTPNTDYFGNDSFVVQVSDGTNTDSIIVNVTIEGTPSIFWTEDFGTGTCANRNQLATSYAGANGSWTQTIMAAEGAVPNQFYISATEAFTGAGNASDGCINNSALTNQTLHMGSLGVGDCPVGDCGATYNFSSNGETHKRIESPTIECTGRIDISVSFDYMMFGQLNTDAASFAYFDGTTWINLAVPLSPQTPCGGGPCGDLFASGLWSATPYSINLPVSANNNPNVKIAFLWDNNLDGIGANPSLAVDNVQVSGIVLPIITEGETINVTMSEDGNPTPFSLTLNATVADNDPLTWSILTPATNGTATASGTGNSKSIGYTPNASYAGTDSFVVQIFDGASTDNITVNVTIEPILDIPLTQTLTGATTITCPQDNTLTLQSSEVGLNYFLRNDATKEIVGNSQVGTGSALNFQTGVVSETTSYHVFAANPSYALNFDGLDDTVEVPHDVSLNFSTGLTLEAWVYPTNVTNGNQEIYRKDNDTQDRILLSFQDNGTTLSFGTHTTGDGYTELDVAINPTDYNNQWVHVLAFFDDATNAMRIYRNGVEIGNKASNGTLRTAINPSSAYIGSLSGTAEFFQGKIASLRIWDKALTTQTEIQQAKDNLFVGDESGLVTYYPFFENTGTVLADVTSNANNGTINGATWVIGTTGGAGNIASNILAQSCSVLSITDFKQELIEIYPNPTNHKIYINGLNTSETIQIYSITGQKLLKTLINNNSYSLDVSKLSNGIYFIKIKNQVLKFIKK